MLPAEYFSAVSHLPIFASLSFETRACNPHCNVLMLPADCHSGWFACRPSRGAVSGLHASHLCYKIAQGLAAISGMLVFRQGATEREWV